jgi:transposase
MERKVYPSDVTREQFETIKPILESARTKTKPRTIDLYDAFCGVQYVLKTGCQWRALPSDFPKWRSVHAYWQIWSEETDDNQSVLEIVLKKIGRRRERRERSRS